LLVELGALQEAQKQNGIELEALGAAVSADVARRLQERPRSAPQIPPAVFRRAAEEPLLQSARNLVRSMLGGLRAALEGMVEKSDTELQNALWPKLSRTLQMAGDLTALVTGAGEGALGGDV
jgi:hypothetical protein